MSGLKALVIENEERERKVIVVLLSSQDIQVDAFQSPWHYRQAVGEDDSDDPAAAGDSFCQHGRERQ